MNNLIPTIIDAASALAIARAHSRFHIFYDEMTNADAARLGEFCRRENIAFRIAPDKNPLFFEIHIPDVDFGTLEMIEAIVDDEKGH
jgi:hypothetical protein